VRRIAVTVLVLALLGGTAAAFTMTEALKLERPPVTAPRFDKVFSPTCGCSTSAARLAFHLRRADRLDLVIVSGDEPVRTLATDLEHARGRVLVRWNGRDDDGAILPDGVYRLRVELADAGRTVVIPKKIRIDTRAPALELVRTAPLAFSPDGDGRRDTLRAAYRADEDAAPVLSVDGRIAVEGRVKRAGERAVVWDGRVGERSLRAGVYRVLLRARDRAGNLSSAAAFSAGIRYVDVVPSAIVARRGTRFRFRVLADAASFSWILRRAHGRVVRADVGAKPGAITVQLPRRIRPGRYVLEVTANGHRDRASVRIVRSGA
jgi:hypothetical protein